MAKRKAVAADPSVTSPIMDDEDVLEVSLPNQDLDWIAKVKDPNNNFFDALAEIPEAGWEKCVLYLYRLEPAVSNKSGDRAYIGVFGQLITEETVKNVHGGGKYQIYLKYGKLTLRNYRFAVDGAAKLQEGQTMRGSGAVVGTVIPPGGSAENNIAQIVAEVIKATKGDPAAANAGLEVMKRAMTDGLDLQKEIAKSQLGSATGNALGDKIVELLLPRLTNPPAAPTMDPLVQELLKATIKNMNAERRTDNPSPAPSSSGELALVKDLLGVDTLKDLINIGGRGKEQPWWATLIVNAVDKLPTLLTEYASMQERAFQRALIAHQAGAGGRITLPAPMIAAPPVRAGAPAPHAAQPEDVGAMSMQMISQLVDAITNAYDEGYSGDAAAIHVRLSFPGLVEVLKPMLSDPAQLAEFVAQTPALADRAKDEEWPEFQEEFIEELLATHGPEPAVGGAGDRPPQSPQVISIPASPEAS